MLRKSVCLLIVLSFLSNNILWASEIRDGLSSRPARGCLTSYISIDGAKQLEAINEVLSPQLAQALLRLADHVNDLQLPSAGAVTIADLRRVHRREAEIISLLVNLPDNLILQHHAQSIYIYIKGQELVLELTSGQGEQNSADSIGPFRIVLNKDIWFQTLYRRIEKGKLDSSAAVFAAILQTLFAQELGPELTVQEGLLVCGAKDDYIALGDERHVACLIFRGEEGRYLAVNLKTECGDVELSSVQKEDEDYLVTSSAGERYLIDANTGKLFFLASGDETGAEDLLEFVVTDSKPWELERVLSTMIGRALHEPEVTRSALVGELELAAVSNCIIGNLMKEKETVAAEPVSYAAWPMEIAGNYYFVFGGTDSSLVKDTLYIFEDVFSELAVARFQGLTLPAYLVRIPAEQIDKSAETVSLRRSVVERLAEDTAGNNQLLGAAAVFNFLQFIDENKRQRKGDFFTAQKESLSGLITGFDPAEIEDETQMFVAVFDRLPNCLQAEFLDMLALFYNSNGLDLAGAVTYFTYSLKTGDLELPAELSPEETAAVINSLEQAFGEGHDYYLFAPAMELYQTFSRLFPRKALSYNSFCDVFLNSGAVRNNRQRIVFLTSYQKLGKRIEEDRPINYETRFALYEQYQELYGESGEMLSWEQFNQEYINQQTVRLAKKELAFYQAYKNMLVEASSQNLLDLHETDHRLAEQLRDAQLMFGIKTPKLSLRQFYRQMISSLAGKLNVLLNRLRIQVEPQKLETGLEKGFAVAIVPMAVVLVCGLVMSACSDCSGKKTPEPAVAEVKIQAAPSQPAAASTAPAVQPTLPGKAALTKGLFNFRGRTIEIRTVNQFNPAWAKTAQRGLDKWLARISKTTTGLPPSHVGDTRTVAIRHGFTTGAFTYDLAHVALRYLRTGQPQKARKILSYFATRYNAYSVSELRNPQNKLIDGNGVYGILRVLMDADGKFRKHIINCVDTSSSWPQGAGIIEWYTDGGPQFWWMGKTAQALMLDRSIPRAERAKFEKFVRGIAEMGFGLMNKESIVAAGPAGQDIDGAPKRERMGHTENMWDMYGFLRQTADYFQNKDRAFAAKCRGKAEKVLRGLKAKGIYQREGKLGYFYQGIRFGKVNKQIPTDVQTWGILSVGPEKLDQVWGSGTTEGLLNWIVQRAMAVTSYVRPDGYKVTTIGVDYSDRNQISRQPMITDEWTGGAILALEVGANYLYKQGKKKEAAKFLAMADALKYFALLRATQHNGEWYWEYATGRNLPTGYGWNTPVAYGGSTAGNWMLFALLGIDPFDPSGKNRRGLNAVRRYGTNNGIISINNGIDLLLKNMGKSKQKFVHRPGVTIKKVAKSRVPKSAAVESKEMLMLDPMYLKKIGPLPDTAVGRSGLLKVDRRSKTIIVKSVALWNSAEVSFVKPIKLKSKGYTELRFRVKGLQGTKAVRVNFVDKHYLAAQNWDNVPPHINVPIKGNGKWQEVVIRLTEAESLGADIDAIGAISFDVGTDTAGNPIKAVVQIRNPRFFKGKRVQTRVPSEIPAPATGSEQKQVPVPVPRPDAESKVDKPASGGRVIDVGRCRVMYQWKVCYKDIAQTNLSVNDSVQVYVPGSGKFLLRMTAPGQNPNDSNMYYPQPLKMGKWHTVPIKKFVNRKGTIKQVSVHWAPNPFGQFSDFPGGRPRAAGIKIKLIKSGHSRLKEKDDKTSRIAAQLAQQLAQGDNTAGLLRDLVTGAIFSGNPRQPFVPGAKAWTEDQPEEEVLAAIGNTIDLLFSKDEEDVVRALVSPFVGEPEAKEFKLIGCQQDEPESLPAEGFVAYRLSCAADRPYFELKEIPLRVLPPRSKKIYAVSNPANISEVFMPALLVRNLSLLLPARKKLIMEQTAVHELLEASTSQERKLGIFSAYYNQLDEQSKETALKLLHRLGVKVSWNRKLTLVELSGDSHRMAEVLELVIESYRRRIPLSGITVSSYDAYILGMQLRDKGYEIDLTEFIDQLTDPEVSPEDIIIGLGEKGRWQLGAVEEAALAVARLSGELQSADREGTHLKATFVLTEHLERWDWLPNDVDNLQEGLGKDVFSYREEPVFSRLAINLKDQSFGAQLDLIKNILLTIRTELGDQAQKGWRTVNVSNPYLHGLLALIGDIGGIRTAALVRAFYNDLINADSVAEKEKMIAAAVEVALLDVEKVRRWGLAAFAEGVSDKLIQQLVELAPQLVPAAGKMSFSESFLTELAV